MSEDFSGLDAWSPWLTVAFDLSTRQEGFTNY